MRQVAAVVEPHGEDGRARLEQRLVGGQIGVGPGVRLHVGVLGAEQGRGPVAGQVLDLVDDLVAAVVAAARVALGVLVGQHRAGGGQHGRRREVLRGDQLQRRLLAVELLADEAGHLGVGGQCGLVACSWSPFDWKLVDETPVRVPASFSSRPSWRPCSSEASRKAASASTATVAPVVRAPTQSTLAWLCRRARAAVVTSWTTAARTPGTLLAAMAMPMPVPQMQTPRSADPRDDGAAHRGAEVRVVDRDPRLEGPVVVHVVALRGQLGLEDLLQIEAGVIRADGDAHEHRVYRCAPEAPGREPVRCPVHGPRPANPGRRGRRARS